MPRRHPGRKPDLGKRAKSESAPPDLPVLQSVSSVDGPRSTARPAGRSHTNSESRSGLLPLPAFVLIVATARRHHALSLSTLPTYRPKLDRSAAARAETTPGCSSRAARSLVDLRPCKKPIKCGYGWLAPRRFTSDQAEATSVGAAGRLDERALSAPWGAGTRPHSGPCPGQVAARRHQQARFRRSDQIPRVYHQQTMNLLVPADATATHGRPVAKPKSGAAVYFGEALCIR